VEELHLIKTGLTFLNKSRYETRTILSQRGEQKVGGQRRTILVPPPSLRGQQKENRSPSPIYPRKTNKQAEYQAPASSRQSIANSKAPDSDKLVNNVNNNVSVNGNGAMMPPPKAPPRKGTFFQIKSIFPPFFYK